MGIKLFYSNKLNKEIDNFFLLIKSPASYVSKNYQSPSPVMKGLVCQPIRRQGEAGLKPLGSDRVEGGGGGDVMSSSQRLMYSGAVSGFKLHPNHIWKNIFQREEEHRKGGRGQSG